MNPLNFFRYFGHIFRRKFEEKYIIIESDDWGMERAICSDSVNWLEKKFGRDKLTRWSYDSLETSEDLQMLFGVLEEFRNTFVCPPVITANFITHNISYSGNSLEFIPISSGFNFDSEDVRDLYKSGIEKKLIEPQLHGYSHYNLIELEKYFPTEEGQEAFAMKFLAGRSTVRGNLGFLQGEFGSGNSGKIRIKEAVDAFVRLFGIKPVSLIPPTFIFDKEYSREAADNGVKLMQSSNRLLSSEKKRYNYPFFRKSGGLYWSVRNARLDPHDAYNFSHEQCIEYIRKAFGNKLPAVIDFHRVNFAGRFAPEYRDRTISELRKLFTKISDMWKDVKFISTGKLCRIISDEN